MPRRPIFDERLKGFFRRLGPATIGTAGLQIAIFVDTGLSSLLGQGAMASIYNAERLYQLPIGVIGIAAGTVLLSEVSRRVAQGDLAGAVHAQNRAMGWTLMLAAPFVVAFLLIPDLILAALLVHGRFHLDAAEAAGAVLAAYALGLPAVVLIRSAVAPFQGRGDTKTPMLVALAAIARECAAEIPPDASFRRVGPRARDFGRRLDQFPDAHIFWPIAKASARTDQAFVKTLAVVRRGLGGACRGDPRLRSLARFLTNALPYLQRETRLAALVLIGAIVYASILVTGARVTGFSLRR